MRPERPTAPSGRGTPSPDPQGAEPESVGSGSAGSGDTRGDIGPFVTFIESERPDGLVAHWESRRQRKHAGPNQPNETWWDPAARGWWIGVLFAVGSALFALGAVPGFADAVGVRADSTTFFVGSLFFTTAAFLQYRESVDAGIGRKARGWRRVFTMQWHQIDWWASGIQLVGTLYFNVSTGNAVRIDLSAAAAHQHIWRPDALGSACFLVASCLAWSEVCHGWVAWSPGLISWWITGLNLIGSIAFGGSAIAGYIVPATGKIWNAELSNLGTFVGALCFLAGGMLLLPERTEGEVAPSPTSPVA
jgi:hypothetical protein